MLKKNFQFSQKFSKLSNFSNFRFLPIVNTNVLYDFADLRTHLGNLSLMPLKALNNRVQDLFIVFPELPVEVTFVDGQGHDYSELHQKWSQSNQ